MKALYTFKSLMTAGLLGADGNGSDVTLSDEEIHNVLVLLKNTGYLRPQLITGQMDDQARDALRRFQGQHRLEPTGLPDLRTLQLMQQPRCGVPDFPRNDARDRTAPAPPFIIKPGCSYPFNELSYAIDKMTGDISESRVREIIKEAFTMWQNVSPLRFTEVDVTAGPHLVLSWESGSHGDNRPFNDEGISKNAIAHAYFPPPCDNGFAGKLHFDASRRWTDAAAPDAFRLLPVALHEIGHLLGLDHSDTNNAVMYASYVETSDTLQQDDIDGIRFIYPLV